MRQLLKRQNVDIFPFENEVTVLHHFNICETPMQLFARSSTLAQFAIFGSESAQVSLWIHFYLE